MHPRRIFKVFKANKHMHIMGVIFLKILNPRIVYIYIYIYIYIYYCILYKREEEKKPIKMIEESERDKKNFLQ